MLSLKGLAAAFCFAALLCPSPHVLAGPERRSIEPFADCIPPPDGVWSMTHNLPIPDDETTLLLQGRSILHLTNPSSNIYTGSGSGLAVDSLNPDFPDGAPFQYSVIMFFDPVTCTLAGSVYNLEAPFVDAAAWFYNGETMSGPMVNTNNGTLFFTRTGRQDLTFLGTS